MYEYLPYKNAQEYWNALFNGHCVERITFENSPFNKNPGVFAPLKKLLTDDSLPVFWGTMPKENCSACYHRIGRSKRVQVFRDMVRLEFDVEMKHGMISIRNRAAENIPEIFACLLLHEKGHSVCHARRCSCSQRHTHNVPLAEFHAETYKLNEALKIGDAKLVRTAMLFTVSMLRQLPPKPEESLHSIFNGDANLIARWEYMEGYVEAIKSDVFCEGWKFLLKNGIDPIDAINKCGIQRQSKKAFSELLANDKIPYIRKVA